MNPIEIDTTEFFKWSAEKRENMAPRSHAIAKNNHYIPQFFQKSWAEVNRAKALFANNPRIQRKNVDGTMSENYLYTIKELDNPNFFEKLRGELESPLVDPIKDLEQNNFTLSDESCAKLIALLACGSPVMMQQYYDLSHNYLSSTNSSIEIEEWRIKEQACSRMIRMAKNIESRMISDYTFKIIKTVKQMALADYPIIQIYDEDVIHREVGYYSLSNYMILPIHPNAYLIASKKDNSHSMQELTALEVNDLQVRSANRVLISKNEDTLLSTVDYTRALLNLPLPVQWLVATSDEALMIIMSNHSKPKWHSTNGSASVHPRIYSSKDIVTVVETRIHIIDKRKLND